MNEPKPASIRLGFEAKGIRATMTLPDCALPALLALLKVKDSPDVWAILEMSCEWDFADVNEKDNIRRTVSEMLEPNEKAHLQPPEVEVERKTK